MAPPSLGMLTMLAMMRIQGALKNLSLPSTARLARCAALQAPCRTRHTREPAPARRPPIPGHVRLQQRCIPQLPWLRPCLGALLRKTARSQAGPQEAKLAEDPSSTAAAASAAESLAAPKMNAIAVGLPLRGRTVSHHLPGRPYAWRPGGPPSRLVSHNLDAEPAGLTIGGSEPSELPG